MAVGIVFLTVALFNIIQYKRLSEAGEYTRATITRLDKSSNSETPTCSADYAFNGPSKSGGSPIKFQGSENISCSLYSDLKIGKTIGINYDASDPKTSKIKGNVWPQVTYLITGVGAILFALSPMGKGLESRRILRQLSEEGQQTQAFVFDLWQEKDSEDQVTYQVAYAFKIPTDQGQQIITRAERSYAAYSNYRIGSCLTVRYLPSNPIEVCRLVLS